MKKQLNFKEMSKEKIVKLVLAVCFVAALAFSVITLASNYVDISRLDAQLTQAQAAYDAQEAENDKILAILNSDNKDEYIEQKAREKGYIKSGETVFYDISTSK